MAVLNSKDLKQQAARRLEQTSAHPRKLVLIYTGLIVLLNLAINGLNFVLTEQIAGTGGLSGLGARSVLETLQTLLSYFSLFFTPFWEAGFLFAMISIVRGQDAQVPSLLQGFKRFGRIISYLFWQMTILFMLCFVLVYVVSFLFMMTPYGTAFVEVVEPLMTQSDFLLADGSVNMELLMTESVIHAMIPMFVMFFAVLIPVYVWVSYHLRLTNFLLMEGTNRGALSSMIVSVKMMKGHKWQMLKLDLSFWWYHGLESLLVLVLYLDAFLPLLGVELPMDPTVAYFLTLSLYSLLELGLHLWKKAYVDATYVTAYETIYRQFAGHPSAE